MYGQRHCPFSRNCRIKAISAAEELKIRTIKTQGVSLNCYISLPIISTIAKTTIIMAPPSFFAIFPLHVSKIQMLVCETILHMQVSALLISILRLSPLRVHELYPPFTITFSNNFHKHLYSEAGSCARNKHF